MKLQNKFAIITGGSSGIGKAVAKQFIAEGAQVIVFDIKPPDYEVNFKQVNVTNENLVQEELSKLAQLDILVNSAGIYFQASIEDTTKQQLDNIVDLNIKGTFLMCKHAVPLLKKTKGTIINISSGLGIVPEPESPAYCATKAAVIMLTKALAQTYIKDGLRVNSVAPGPIDTPLLRATFSNTEEMENYFKEKPIARVGRPEEVASVVTFLASEEASYVNGAIYTVDGGESSSSLYSK